MRIGAFLSAGGSSFCEAARIAAALPLQFHVITDRACVAEARCSALGMSVERIVNRDRDEFSRAARAHLVKQGVELVLLHFSRLIGSDLFTAVPCCNVHPSILPAFAGLSPINRAWRSGVRLIGATLHFVDDSIDGGPIIAQTATPLELGADLAWCERASFLQKTLMTLIFFELAIANRLRRHAQGWTFDLSDLSSSAHVNPTLKSQSLIDGMTGLQADVGFNVFP
jgi:phosphoribosylglycinamide formyltransferase 1